MFPSLCRADLRTLVSVPPDPTPSALLILHSSTCVTVYFYRDSGDRRGGHSELHDGIVVPGNSCSVSSETRQFSDLPRKKFFDAVSTDLSSSADDLVVVNSPIYSLRELRAKTFLRYPCDNCTKNFSKGTRSSEYLDAVRSPCVTQK